MRRVDFAAVLRSNVWTDGMQRFVGVNPRAASATDWHARKMPRRPLPAERQRPPHMHRAQAAESDSSLASGSTLIIPDRGAVVSDEVRWGCHSRDAAPASVASAARPKQNRILSCARSCDRRAP